MARILIVEDEYILAAYLDKELAAQGHRVALARDGREGLSLARSFSPDLILMDLGLPRLNGWEVTRQLKADPATSTIPVVALTSATTSADRDEAYEAGCDAFESKPVDLNRLQGRIKDLIRH